MPEPSYDDLADTITANFRSLRYMETSMETFYRTVWLVQVAALSLLVVAIFLLVKKVHRD